MRRDRDISHAGPRLWFADDMPAGGAGELHRDTSDPDHLAAQIDVAPTQFDHLTESQRAPTGQRHSEFEPIRHRRSELAEFGHRRRANLVDALCLAGAADPARNEVNA